jgi:hypothetical protein
LEGTVRIVGPAGYGARCATILAYTAHQNDAQAPFYNLGGAICHWSFTICIQRGGKRHQVVRLHEHHVDGG